MKLFTAEQIKRWDQATIAKGIPSIQLMERAVNALIPKILTLVSNRCCVALFAGPGNNGGDALALSRLLVERGFEQVHTYLVSPEGTGLSEDCRSNLERTTLESTIKSKVDIPSVETLSTYDLIIDGLFGSGLTRPLEGVFAETVKRINAADSRVFSIDIPSGAFSEQVNSDHLVVEAEHVLTFQIPKRSFLVPESNRYMKDFEVVDIHLDPEYHEQEPCDWYYLQASDVEIEERQKFSHKGHYGHGLLMAGSRGMYGAAQLSARAAMRAGCGLLTVHAPAESMTILQATLPEAMFSPDKQIDHISRLPDIDAYTAMAVGPGLGQAKDTIGMLDALLERAPQGLILDADALNILAREGWQERIPAGSIITPHPKEFARLFGESKDSFEALEKQKEIAQKQDIIIIRKGAHSSVALPDGRLYFNSTGNPYMATGGMGDVLTGFILGLLTQGLSPEKAALAGVYYHGSAGDMALQRRRGGLLLSTDVIEAFKL
ncbi:MAG: NAD(P)H-hydrate dehydratase [Flavobacteriales bacterium]|nr:NAD(P)H-hydrate dehydratase [Flavobacteriales bacterium]